MLRAVLDVNVLVSAVLPPGICRSIVLALEKDKFSLVLSPVLFEDFLRAMEKPKLKKLVSGGILEDIIVLIHSKAWIVEPKTRLHICRDPSDDAVIECAVESRSDVIVSGDKDLLSLGFFRQVSVLSPRAFARKIRVI